MSLPLFSEGTPQAPLPLSPASLLSPLDEVGGDSSVTALREWPISFNGYIECHGICVSFLFNEFPVDGHLGCFQSSANTNNPEMYVLDILEKSIELLEK